MPRQRIHPVVACPDCGLENTRFIGWTKAQVPKKRYKCLNTKCARNTWTPEGSWGGDRVTDNFSDQVEQEAIAAAERAPAKSTKEFGKTRTIKDGNGDDPSKWQYILYKVYEGEDSEANREAAQAGKAILFGSVESARVWGNAKGHYAIYVRWPKKKNDFDEKGKSARSSNRQPNARKLAKSK